MIHTWHHRRGGDATYTSTLSSLLERAGHEVFPLAMRHPENDPSPWEARFVPWIELSAARGATSRLRMLRDAMWSPSSRDAARAMLRETGAELAHLQHIHRHITPSVLDALDDAGVPAVWTLHDHELSAPRGTCSRTVRRASGASATATTRRSSTAASSTSCCPRCSWRSRRSSTGGAVCGSASRGS
jgi:hypothetical protein